MQFYAEEGDGVAVVHAAFGRIVAIARGCDMQCRWIGCAEKSRLSRTQSSPGISVCLDRPEYREWQPRVEIPVLVGEDVTEDSVAVQSHALGGAHRLLQGYFASMPEAVIGASQWMSFHGWSIGLAMRVS